MHLNEGLFFDDKFISLEAMKALEQVHLIGPPQGSSGHHQASFQEQSRFFSLGLKTIHQREDSLCLLEGPPSCMIKRDPSPLRKDVEMKHYDMIVIGTGAGNIILELAQKAGKKCAQIERAKFGGTCLTRGCIPTKVLVTAADRVYEMRESAHIGVSAGEPKVDWTRISERVWEKIDASKALRQSYLDDPELDVYEGTGFFLDDKTIQVAMKDGSFCEPMTADRIYIGTGGRTHIPDIEGLDNIPFWTSERFFSEEYPKKPFKDIIVVGGGAIGSEFAHIFRAFGAKVQLVQHNVRLLPKEDEEISAALLEQFKLDGIITHLHKKTPKIREHKGEVYLTLRDRTTGEVTEIKGQDIFICPGIVPNSEALKLENTSIEVDEQGWIRTNEFLETTVPNVYAFGDINGLQQFRHKANYEADILGYNHYISKDPDDKRWAEYDLVPAATFTHPEVAHVGMTEAQADAAGFDVRLAYNHYRETAKGFALGYDEENPNPAFAKLVIDGHTDKILGIHIMGPMASALIQPFVNLMNAGNKKIKPHNAEIASAETRRLRALPLVRNLDPTKETTVKETMVAHPSLAEVSIWTYYGFTDEDFSLY